MGWLRDGWDLGHEVLGCCVLVGQGRVLVDLAGRWKWKGRPIGRSASRHGAFMRAWVSPVGLCHSAVCKIVIEIALFAISDGFSGHGWGWRVHT